MREAAMKSLNMKLVLSALGIVVALASPAFAKTPQGNGAGAYNTIPGYDRDGNVVAVPNPDR
jgi:hypothetical protein